MRFKIKDLRLKKSLTTYNLQLTTCKGFTFIEILIYIAIIAIVIVSFIGFGISISESKNKAYVTTEVFENARSSMSAISQRIKAAQSVNVSGSTFGSDPGVLSLAMGDTNFNPIIIQLDTDDGTLQIAEGVSGPVNITTNKVRVTNLVFTNLTSLLSNRENIRVEITIAYNSDSSDIEYDYSYSLETAVSLRQ